MFLVDLVIWDPPFGLHGKEQGFEWDLAAPTEDKILELLDQLVITHSDSKPGFFVYVHADKSMFVDMIKVSPPGPFPGNSFTG